MKTITLNIPDGQRIGEAIYKAIIGKFPKNLKPRDVARLIQESSENLGVFLYDIEDQDLLSLLQKKQ